MVKQQCQRAYILCIVRQYASQLFRTLAVQELQPCPKGFAARQIVLRLARCARWSAVGSFPIGPGSVGASDTTGPHAAAHQRLRLTMYTITPTQQRRVASAIQS